MLKGTLAKRIKKTIREKKAGSSKDAPVRTCVRFSDQAVQPAPKRSRPGSKKSLPLKDCYPDLRRINY